MSVESLRNPKSENGLQLQYIQYYLLCWCVFFNTSTVLDAAAPLEIGAHSFFRQRSVHFITFSSGLIFHMQLVKIKQNWKKLPLQNIVNP